MSTQSKKIIISYVPVIHAGYISFFNKHKGAPFYLLGEDIIEDYSNWDREIRALKPKEMNSLIGALGVFSSISILDKEQVENLKKVPDVTFVLPDEDVSRGFVKDYLSSNQVEYDSIFLRWNKQITEHENEIPSHRTISEDEVDKELLKQAINEKEKSSDWWRQVGAIVVKDGEILLSGHNKHLPSQHTPYSNGDPRNDFDAGQRIDLSTAIHAEASIIAKAAKEGIPLDGLSLYVTIFPCPGCAKLIVESGIKKIYYEKGYSLLDAENLLSTHGIEIVLVKNT